MVRITCPVMERFAVSRLVGTPPAVGYDEANSRGGAPAAYTVLLDGIEKARSVLYRK